MAHVDRRRLLYRLLEYNIPHQDALRFNDQFSLVTKNYERQLLARIVNLLNITFHVNTCRKTIKLEFNSTSDWTGDTKLYFNGETMLWYK